MSHGNGSKLGYVSLYFGRRGSGKTQQAVIDAYEAHLAGEIIISNIWLNFPHIRYRKMSELVPIMREIAGYCNEVKMPTEAPNAMLKEYNMKRRKGKVNKFFLIIDEAGNHLDSRNWQRNFKEEFLVDMLTEPRKYGLTIIGITQEWSSIDKKFRGACEDWFLFSKAGKWIFEHMNCTHIWVVNGEFDWDKPMILDKKRKFVYFDRHLSYFRTLYWTGELNGVGSRENVPHSFEEGVIYQQKKKGILPLIRPVPEKGAQQSGANMGEDAEQTGVSPT